MFLKSETVSHFLTWSHYFDGNFLYNPPQTTLPLLKKNKKNLHLTLNQH